MATIVFSLYAPVYTGNHHDYLHYDMHECSWNTTQCQHQQIQTLILPPILASGSGTGTMPPEVALLTSLQAIQFQSSQGDTTSTTGAGTSTTILCNLIPHSLAMRNLPNLQTLRLSLQEDSSNPQSSRISGTLPIHQMLPAWHTLQSIQLPNNDLQGDIPTTVGLLNHLVSLNLKDNHMAGTIPSELGLLRHLESLDLRSNHLVGTVPTSLGLLTRLTKLHLGGNTGLVAMTTKTMTDTFPREICDLPLLEEMDCLAGVCPCPGTKIRCTC
ncbi:leucine rich repeat [Seminavis robusta]|uniref:Leucine rich repeat n=1 Tax=Seminavis robusta TaxID=568900 RepID=A0A9N8D8B8_9STRA|nr:leucine rich repeat [Seminavis robusta]|eukprot:Sro33_g021520.1 leucine rich repeat (271) ;mRNA; r:98704-99516